MTIISIDIRIQKSSGISLALYVTRFELATFWSVARRSIQLSYTYISAFLGDKLYYNPRKA